MAKLGGAKDFAIPAAGAGGGATQLSDLTDVGVTTPTNGNILQADGDSWESVALATGANFLDATNFSALTQSVLDDASATTNWSALKADVAVATTGSLITVGLEYDENDIGSQLIWTNPGSVDMSSHGLIKISNLKFATTAGISTTIEHFELWFQDASGTNHTKIRLQSYELDIAHDLYVTLEDATDVTKIILAQIDVDTGANNNTISIEVGAIEKPAMPKWWAALVSEANAAVWIPADYTDAVSDPVCMTPASTVLIDGRDSQAPIHIWMPDGTQRQIKGMPATFGTACDDHLAFFAGWLAKNPGCRVLMPRIPGWEITGGTADDETGDIRFYDHHTSIDWNDICIWGSASGRVAKNIIIGGNASNFKWKNLKSFGHRETSLTLSATDQVELLDVGGSATQGATVVLPGAGDSIITFKGQHGPVPQTDGRFFVEWDIVVSDSDGTNTNGMEIFGRSEPLIERQTLTTYNSGAGYRWIQAPSDASGFSYYLEKDDGTEDEDLPWDTVPTPSVVPDAVIEDGSDLTLESYSSGFTAASKFDVGAFDGQTNETIYVRLSGNDDPDGHTMTVRDDQYAHFSAYAGNAEQVLDKFIEIMNVTNGATTGLFQTDWKSAVRGYNFNNQREWSGGSRQNFISADQIDIYEKPYQEVWTGGAAVLDSTTERPTTKITPTSGQTTYTLKMELPRHYWFNTQLVVRNLNGSSTLTIHSITAKNIVTYNSSFDKATALSILDANRGEIENYLGSSASSDGLHLNGEHCADILVRNFKSQFNRRQGMAVTQGRNLTFEDGELVAASRALVDIEPSSRQAEGINMRRIRGGGQDKTEPNSLIARIGNTMTAAITGRHHASYFDQLNFTLKPSPSQVPNGMTKFGASQQQDFLAPSMQIGSYVSYDGGSVIIAGEGVVCDSITTHSFRWDSNTQRCSLNTLNILPPRQPDGLAEADVPNTIGPYYEDRGISNYLGSYVELGEQQWTSATSNIDVNVQPFDLTDATTPRIGTLALTFMRLNYPFEYEALVQVTSPQFMGGLNLYAGQVYDLKALASTSSRRDGQNFANKRAESAGSSYQIGTEYEGAVRAILPLHHDRTFTAGLTWSENSSSLNHTVGSLSGSTTYYYRAAPKFHRHYGPQATPVEDFSVTTTAGHDAVKVRLNRVPRNTFGYQYASIFRGTAGASGPFTHRYDLYPTLDLKGDTEFAQDHILADLGALMLVNYPDSWTTRTGWTISGTNSEYYLAAGSTVTEPLAVVGEIGGVHTVFTAGTLGSLSNGEWAYGDNDSLGYDTIYVKEAAGDPDTGMDLIETKSDLPGLPQTITAKTGQVTGTPSPFTVTANSGFTRASDSADPWAASTTVIPISGVWLDKYDIKPGYRVDWDAATTTAALQSTSATIKEVWPTAIVVDAAMAGTPVAGDIFTVHYEYGTGGYQLSGGVMTYTADQMNDERGWEPDANYVVTKIDPHTETPAISFAYVRTQTFQWDWQIVKLFFDSTGKLVSPTTNDGWQDFMIASGG